MFYKYLTILKLSMMKQQYQSQKMNKRLITIEFYSGNICNISTLNRVLQV